MIHLLMERDLFTVIRYGSSFRDPLGKMVRSEISRTVTDGRLEQMTSVEGEAFVVGKFRAYFPVNTPLHADDEVLARGVRYQVQGEPSVESVPGMAAVSNVSAVLTYLGPVTQ